MTVLLFQIFLQDYFKLRKNNDLYKYAVIRWFHLDRWIDLTDLAWCLMMMVMMMMMIHLAQN